MYQASSVPSLVHCKKDTNTGRLKEFGYTNMWSTWIHHNLSSNHNRERLQIVKLFACSFIDWMLTEKEI